MIICLAQIHSVIGAIEDNTEHHVQTIKSAVSKGADVIFFPEMSLTGYTLELASWTLPIIHTIKNTEMDDFQPPKNDLGIGRQLNITYLTPS